MNRRGFMRSAAWASAAALTPMRLYAQPQPYEGRLLVVLQAEGGWDVSSFCDPKQNLPGEQEISHWSRQGDTRTAGGIPYAPFADNRAFFERHHRDLLVINGVDAQTNSHSTGVLHNWSGRNAAGYPTLTGLFAAHNAPDVPLSYINFGGFAEGARLIRYNRLDDVYSLYSLLEPNKLPWDPGRVWRRPQEMSVIERYQRERLQRAIQNPQALPRERYNASSQYSALDSRDLLNRLTAVLPAASEIEEGEDVNEEVYSDLRRQAQLAILCFKAGVACAADLILYGFDTHAEHDDLHAPLFSHLTRSVEYLWDTAEQHGVADRLTLVIGSDFARTPYYNADNGKDHWPIGSVVVMEKQPVWGGRVVGLTDGGQNAAAINPLTLQPDSGAGTLIYPRHVHKAMRRYLGLENTAEAARFLFNNTEDFDFFNPAL
jgi:hypothetical protein